MARAVVQLPQLVLDDEAIGRLHHGLGVTYGPLPPGDEMAVLDTAGRLAAIVRPQDGQTLQPVRNFEI